MTSESRDVSDMLAELERLEKAARANGDADTPWSVWGDSKERPPMILDAHSDHVVCQLDDGRPYFELETAAVIAAARNHLPLLLGLAKLCLEARELLLYERQQRALGVYEENEKRWHGKFDSLSSPSPSGAAKGETT